MMSSASDERKPGGHPVSDSYRGHTVEYVPEATRSEPGHRWRACQPNQPPVYFTSLVALVAHFDREAGAFPRDRRMK